MVNLKKIVHYGTGIKLMPFPLMTLFFSLCN
jgi:hypothetical protein